jgi:hypothetical protein
VGVFPLDRLLEGSDLPISHIWRAFDPRAFHPHVDWNTCGAAFLIPAAKKVFGGDLVVTPEKGKCYSIPTSYGRIIGGRWATRAHCNENVYAGTREVYVLYLDKRVCSEKYINRSSEDSQLFFSEEEKRAMDEIREEGSKMVKEVEMEPLTMDAGEHSTLECGIA